MRFRNSHQQSIVNNESGRAELPILYSFSLLMNAIPPSSPAT